MAVNDSTTINGVTKIETETGFRYLFPLATIETNTNANVAGSITITELRAGSQSRTFDFDNLSNQYSTTNAEGYVDYLASNGFYFTINGSTTQPLIESLNTSELNASKILAPNGSGGVEWTTLNINQPQKIVLVNQSNLSTVFNTVDSTVLYLIDGDLDFSGVTIEVPTTGIFIAGHNLDLSFMRCSDNGYTMFSSPVSKSGNVFIRDVSIEVNGSNSKVFDIEDATGFNAVEFNRVNWNNCTSMGEIDGYRQGLELGTGRFGGAPSLTLSGTWLGGYFIDTSIVRSLTNGSYSLYQAGQNFTMASRFRSNQNIDLPANTSFFDFSQSNFSNPSTVQIQSALVSRNGVFNASDSNITPNIDQASLASSWNNNIGMPNTFEGGRLTVNSANQTNIPSGSTWVTLNGIWTASALEHFDSPSSGQLRHLGDSPREYKCTINFVIESQQNAVIGIRLRRFNNSTGSFVDFIERKRVVNNLVQGRDVAFFNFSFNVNLAKNDYVYFQVRNNSGNQNLTLEVDSDYILEER